MTKGTVLAELLNLWNEYHTDWNFGRFIATVINGSCYDSIYEISDESFLNGIAEYLKEQKIMEEINADDDYWNYIMEQYELNGEGNREY